MSHIPFQTIKGFQGFLSLGDGLQKDGSGNIRLNTGSGLTYNTSKQLENHWYDVLPPSDFDMNNNKITNMADPTSAQDAVTLNYLDGGMTSDINMNAHKVTNMANPSNPQDGVTLNYLEGGSMASDINMNSHKITNMADPTNTQDALTFNYLHSGVMSENVDMNSNNITSLGEPYVGTDAVNKSYVDSRKPLSQLHTGLRGYWALDGNYNDSYGNYNGSETGGSSLTFSSTAIIGQSLKFSGTKGDYVSLGAGAFNFANSDFSLQVWVYHPTIPSSQVSYFITYNGSSNWITGGVSYNGVNKFYIQTGKNSSYTTKNFSNNTLQTNQWYHLVLVRTGGTNYTLYVNGQKDSTVTQTSGIYSGTHSYIGHDGGANGNEYLDEVGAWDRALTASEIRYLYHNGKATQDFVTYDYCIPQDLDMCNHSILNLASAQTNGYQIGSGGTTRDNTVPNPIGAMLIKINGNVGLFMYDITNSSITMVSQLGSSFSTTSGNSGTVNVYTNNSGGLPAIRVQNNTSSAQTFRLLNVF